MSIKRINGYMTPRTKKAAPKSYTCALCGKQLEPKDAYFYVDGCNCAITDSALPYCIKCYADKYGRW